MTNDHYLYSAKSFSLFFQSQIVHGKSEWKMAAFKKGDFI